MDVKVFGGMPIEADEIRKVLYTMSDEVLANYLAMSALLISLRNDGEHFNIMHHTETKDIIAEFETAFSWIKIEEKE